MNKILGFIALCAAIVVGAKFYLEYRYKQELDKVLQGARLFAEVNYKDLNVGFDGSVELKELRITPNEQFESFKVNSIKLTGLDLLFHFNGKSRLEKGEFPKFLSFAIRQMSFPSSVYEDLVAEEECKSLSGTLLYSSAGFDQVVLNGKMDLDLADPFAAAMRFSGSDQVSRSSFEIDFNARNANAIAIATEGIPIQSMRYDYFLDEEAAQSMLKHCADKFKITPDDFVEKVVKSPKFMANTVSMDLGEDARNAMANFIQGGKELIVRSTPSDRFKNPQFLSTSSTAQIIRMLNLKVSLDGSSVAIRTFNTAASNEELALEDGEELDAENAEGFQRRNLDDLLNNPDGTVQERVRPNLVKKRKKPSYERATLSRIRDYIDQDVRVTRTKDRSPIEGRLLGSKDRVLSVEVFKHSGVMTLTVPYKDIARLDVKKPR